MALKMNVTATFPGLTKEVKDAYLRIIKISGNKNGLNIELGYHENSDARFPFNVESFNFVPSENERWDDQAYKHLKKQEKFSSAIDC
jgi:hypothetical protein